MEYKRAVQWSGFIVPLLGLVWAVAALTDANLKGAELFYAFIILIGIILTLWALIIGLEGYVPESEDSQLKQDIKTAELRKRRAELKDYLEEKQ